MEFTADQINAEALAAKLTEMAADVNGDWESTKIKLARYQNSRGEVCEVHLVITSDDWETGDGKVNPSIITSGSSSDDGK